MSRLNKAVLLVSIVLMAPNSLAGSLTITTKDQDGQTRTVVEETYDTPVYSKPIKPPTKYQRLQPPSTPVITEKQADHELAQKVAHEENLLRNRIKDAQMENNDLEKRIKKFEEKLTHWLRVFEAENQVRILNVEINRNQLDNLNDVKLLARNRSIVKS
jgi:hypothetical protein